MNEHQKKQKFFFDLHNFDEDADEPAQEEIDQEELERIAVEQDQERQRQEEIKQAREEAYQQGKKDGFEESRQSLEQKIAHLLDTAQNSFDELQRQEHLREQRYEREAVHLSSTLLHKLFPVWADTYGLEEIEQQIREVLQRAANQQAIRIEVSPSILEELQKRLEPVITALSDISVFVSAREDLPENDFKMSWANGGAVRDSQQLVEQILQEFQSAEMGAAEEALAHPAEDLQNEKKIPPATSVDTTLDNDPQNQTDGDVP